MASRENEVVASCLEYLRFRKVFCWRQNQGGVPDGKGRFRKFNSTKGIADIIGVLPGGRMLAVECKTPKAGSVRGGVVSKDQLAFAESVNGAGGLAIVVTSAAELATELEGLL